MLSRYTASDLCQVRKILESGLVEAMILLPYLTTPILLND